MNNRTPDGKPLCSYCGVPRRPCAGCGKTHRPNGRTPDGKPLCQTCWAKHPAALHPCTACGSLNRHFHFGLCAACAARRHLTEALTGTDGKVRPELTTVVEAMLRPPPLAVLRWVRKSPPGDLRGPGQRDRSCWPRPHRTGHIANTDKLSVSTQAFPAGPASAREAFFMPGLTPGHTGPPPRSRRSRAIPRGPKHNDFTQDEGDA